MSYFSKVENKTESQPHLSGQHDCGPRALMRLMPNLKVEQIREAFFYSTDKWPYGPVNNKEMNIALRYLGIYEKFDYREHLGTEIKTMRYFTKLPKDKFIVLLKGHFTAFINGEVHDGLFISSPENFTFSDTRDTATEREFSYDWLNFRRVYFSWRLIT